MLYGSDLSKYHRADLMREAERFRLSKETVAAQAAERRATLRKVMSAAVSLLAWPIRH